MGVTADAVENHSPDKQLIAFKNISGREGSVFGAKDELLPIFAKRLDKGPLFSAAMTIRPGFASIARSTTTRSPSKIPTALMLSPPTLARKT